MQNDHWKKIIASADVADKPPGVTTLEWLTDKYEREEKRPRTVAAAIRAKIEAHELSRVAAAARNHAKAVTAAVVGRPAVKRSAKASQSELEKAAKQGFAAAAAPQPAPSRTPLNDELAKLSGARASEFYKANRSGLRAEAQDQAAEAIKQIKNR